MPQAGSSKSGPAGPIRLWKEEKVVEYLHTMVRVSDLDSSLEFYCRKLGLVEVKRMENEKGRYTLVYLATPEDVDGLGQSEGADDRTYLQLGP